MADVSSLPVSNFGDMLGIVPQNLAGADEQFAAANQRRATTGLIGEQTVGANIQNQEAAMKLAFLKQQMQGMGNGVVPLSGSSDDASGVASPSTGDPKQDFKNYITATANRGYSPRTWNPQDQMIYNQYAQQDAISAKMGIPTNKAAQFKGQFDATNQQKQQQAGNDYQMYAMAAKFGYDGLNSLPNGRALAGALQKAGFSDDDVKDLAEHMAPTAHIFSGRKTKYENGMAVDEDSGMAIPGVNRLGMSVADAEKQADSPATWYDSTNNEVNGTLSQKLGKNRQSYINELVHSGEQAANTPTPSSPAAQEVRAKASVQAATGLNAPTGKGPANDLLNRTGLTPDQMDFIKNSQSGFSPPPSGSRLNETNTTDYSTYKAQSKQLAVEANTATSRAQEALANVSRINNLLQTPGLKTGPGAKEYTQMQTVFSTWFGTDSGQAAANQILGKILSTGQMNDILSKFHGEGAQVRLGAYESRLIMEHLTANPGMTMDAIKQMLAWENSDGQYQISKYKTASAMINAKKDVATFDTDYENKFPPIKNTNVTADILNARPGSKIKETPAEGSPAASSLAMPTGAKLQHYADTVHGGDLDAAKAFLAAKGYK